MKIRLLFVLSCLAIGMKASAIQWYDSTHAVNYTQKTKCAPVVDIALEMFCSDMVAVTGKQPVAKSNATIEIYEMDNMKNAGMKRLKAMGIPTDSIRTKMDAFFLGVRKGKIIILGNNGRGTAYGIMELSRKAGVSPWIWWGDVVPEKKTVLSLADDFETMQSPSVAYRGIFLNDEDDSTLPWAQNFNDTPIDKKSKQKVIGPKAYKRIFELMIRLRANMLWPAMHEATKAFFSVPGNKEMADSCGIVLGSSHCEPLLRSNTGEWDKKKLGAYNFITNRQAVENYWAERLDEMKGKDAFFTIGMRGIHDDGMEGVKTPKERLDGLQSVIDAQRELIRNHYSGDVEKVPQVFIPYKEVLEIYEQGLRVPDDVTLMWCDDNYGYMTRLSDAEQQKRQGGGGIYYHLSYCGRPHSYLWLTETQPGLIYNELKTAYDHNARKVWVINVHDPKVAAYDLSLCMDMAWNIDSIKPNTIRQHLNDWLTQQFGEQTATVITPAMEEFYRLTGIRKSEFMGWTQIELDPKLYPKGRSLPKGTEFSETEFGDELQRYLEQWDAIVKQVKDVGRNDDSYFAHVVYPVECAAAMAHKHLDAQRGDTLPTVRYQDVIRDLTKRYNNMADGKWRGIMKSTSKWQPALVDFSLKDTVIISHSASRPLSPATLDGCLVRNASSFDSNHGEVQPIEMLGHSMNAVSIVKGASLTYRFHADREGDAVIRTALIPTQANDKGDIRYSISIDGGTPEVYSLKEPYRSEKWKTNVMRGQTLRTTNITLSPGEHTITITALDDHIIFDQWMLDYNKDRKFYVFPISR